MQLLLMCYVCQEIEEPICAVLLPVSTDVGGVGSSLVVCLNWALASRHLDHFEYCMLVSDE